MLSREAKTDENQGRDETGHHSRAAPGATVPSNQTSPGACGGDRLLLSVSKHEAADRKPVCVKPDVHHRGQSLTVEKP